LFFGKKYIFGGQLPPALPPVATSLSYTGMRCSNVPLEGSETELSSCRGPGEELSFSEGVKQRSILYNSHQTKTLLRSHFSEQNTIGPKAMKTFLLFFVRQNFCQRHW